MVTWLYSNTNFDFLDTQKFIILFFQDSDTHIASQGFEASQSLGVSEEIWNVSEKSQWLSFDKTCPWFPVLHLSRAKAVTVDKTYIF